MEEEVETSLRAPCFSGFAMLSLYFNSCLCGLSVFNIDARSHCFKGDLTSELFQLESSASLMVGSFLAFNYKLFNREKIADVKMNAIFVPHDVADFRR
jgi:hypothetical protein